MPALADCIVLHGPELAPHRCSRFAWEADTITRIDLGAALKAMPSDGGVTRVVIPGLYNGHTHVGDSALPDGATGLTLEEGFFRPAGYKYRELARLDRADHLAHVVRHLRYMARTGTVGHLDFREQGVAGAELLREAADLTGMASVILAQFDAVPFTADALERNTAPLPPAAVAELAAILRVADGFSESTMNDLTDTAWRQIRDATSGGRALRAIHCLENAGYRDVSLARTGRGDLARALDLYDPDIVVHLTVATAAEIALLAGSRKTGVLNPRANATLGLPLPPVAALLGSGANLLLGTDNVMLNAPSMLAELDFTYRVAKSQFADAVQPDPTAILALATRNIRSVLGGDHHGFLAAGLPATFVVLDFAQPHLRASRHLVASIVGRLTPEDVLATYRMGRPLWRSPDFEPAAA